MQTYRLEFETMYTHKDGGVMGTKHLVILDAESADEALNEARRRFGVCGDLHGSGFKLLRASGETDKKTTTRVHVRPAFV